MKSTNDYKRRKQRREQAERENYQNRASLVDTSKPFQDVTDAQCCTEQLVFAMQDNYHPFSMGLSTILSCLAIAEKEGYVPRLPFDWWNSLWNP